LISIWMNVGTEAWNIEIFMVTSPVKVLRKLV
jgi:hypothetical protein